MAIQSGPRDWNANGNSNPSDGAVRIYGDLAGGRAALHSRRAGHRANVIQSHLGRVRPVMATADGDSTTISQIGGSAFSTTGVLTAATTDPTTFIGGQRRVDIKQVLPNTGNSAGIYTTVAQYYRGDAADRGGFYMAFRWGVGTGQAATTRGFCGVSSSVAAVGDVEPSGLANCVGMGWDAADNEIQIMYRNGTGTTQKIPLYSGIWGIPTTDNSVFFLFELYCPPNGSGISWRIEDPISGAFDFGTLTGANIPDAATMLSPRMYIGVGGVNTVMGITFMNFYAEQDF